MDAFDGLSRLHEVDKVPIDDLRLFPLWNMAGGADDLQCGVGDGSLQFATNLWGKEPIVFTPENQRGVADFVKPGRKVLFP